MTLTEFIPATVLLIFWLVVISINILTLLSAAGKWKLYHKAGQAGWKSLIPLYSDYMDFRIARRLLSYPYNRRISDPDYRHPAVDWVYYFLYPGLQTVKGFRPRCELYAGAGTFQTIVSDDSWLWPRPVS